MKKLGFLIVILSGISIYAFILPKDKASPIEQTKAIARADFESCFAHHFCGGSLFSFLRSASRICLPAPTRRAIAWPIDPAPIRPDIAGANYLKLVIEQVFKRIDLAIFPPEYIF